jgi:HK97 gp10 family phage protein
MAEFIEFDETALAELFGSTNGPAGKYLKRQGLRVQRLAKRNCPVDTGRLRSSITEALGSDSQGLVERIGTDVEYALHVEFGTKRMRAQPFLRPALDAVKDSA